MTKMIEEDYRVVVKEGNAYLLSTVITPLNEEETAPQVQDNNNNETDTNNPTAGKKVTGAVKNIAKGIGKVANNAKEDYGKLSNTSKAAVAVGAGAVGALAAKKIMDRRKKKNKYDD